MARKNRATEAIVSTTPFDVGAWIKEEDQKHPGFADAVEAELASLRLDEQLRDLRKSRKMTQAQVAARMGISQSAVAQLEQADPGRMEVRTLARMATAMGANLRIAFQPMTVPATGPRRVRRAAKR